MDMGRLLANNGQTCRGQVDPKKSQDCRQLVDVIEGKFLALSFLYGYAEATDPSQHLNKSY